MAIISAPNLFDIRFSYLGGVLRVRIDGEELPSVVVELNLAN
jgi:hypothetical protein